MIDRPAPVDDDDDRELTDDEFVELIEAGLERELRPLRDAIEALS